jgi:hypothetical protein
VNPVGACDRVCRGHAPASKSKSKPKPKPKSKSKSKSKPMPMPKPKPKPGERHAVAARLEPDRAPVEMNTIGQHQPR